MWPGTRVRVRKGDLTLEGIVMPKSEFEPENILVIKLKNGYNIGIRLDDAKIEIISEGKPPSKYKAPVTIEKNPSLPTVGIAATGGTIASRVDYTTGAVVAEFTAEDFVLSFPELKELANLELVQVCNIMSEDMEPKIWVRIAETVAKLLRRTDGVVITHGTDTMHFTAAALSFMLKTPKPVVLTGAQRSSDRPSSDAALNLLSSVFVAGHADLSGVFVVMHESMSDGTCLIHPGTRVRKMHTSRRDTFRTIGAKPVGRVVLEARAGKIIEKRFEFFRKWPKRRNFEPEADTKIHDNVALFKFYPGVKRRLVEYVFETYDGIIVEGTGLGHAQLRYFDVIQKALKDGKFVGMTSQCLYGRVHPHVYSHLAKLSRMGVVYLEDMLPETAYVKLMWVMGHTKDPDEIKKIMLTNIAGEITPASDPKAFLG